MDKFQLDWPYFNSLRSLVGVGRRVPRGAGEIGKGLPISLCFVKNETRFTRHPPRPPKPRSNQRFTSQTASKPQKENLNSVFCPSRKNVGIPPISAPDSPTRVSKGCENLAKSFDKTQLSFFRVPLNHSRPLNTPLPFSSFPPILPF